LQLSKNRIESGVRMRCAARRPRWADDPHLHHHPLLAKLFTPCVSRSLTCSGAASYADDVRAAINYPLVRITNLRFGHVFYARAHDRSSMATASNASMTTHLDVSPFQESGPSNIGSPQEKNFLARVS